MVSFLIEDVSDELWQKFKKTLTRDKSINEHLKDIIKKHVEENSE